jgi:hypothetical protein
MPTLNTFSLCSEGVITDETWTLIVAPTSCKVRAVIRFLHAEGKSVAEIHRRLCGVYGDNVMSDSSEVGPKQTAQDAH